MVHYNRGDSSVRSKIGNFSSSRYTTSKRTTNKIISTRLIVMLITINISFCMFSMPMTIIQIIYYSDVHDATSEGSTHANYYSSSSINQIYSFNEHQKHTNKSLTNFHSNVSSSLNNEPFNTLDSVDLVDLLHAIAELLQYLNHGSNFIFYSMSGKTFRNETKRFFCAKFNFIREIFRSKLCKSKCSIAQNNKLSSSLF